MAPLTSTSHVTVAIKDPTFAVRVDGTHAGDYAHLGLAIAVAAISDRGEPLLGGVELGGDHVLDIGGQRVSGRRMSSRSADISGRYLRASLDSFGPVVWMMRSVIGPASSPGGGSKQPADYALPVDGEFAAAERRRMASYACPRPRAIGEGWLCTAPEGALRSPPGGPPAARVLQQPRDGVRQAG